MTSSVKSSTTCLFISDAIMALAWRYNDTKNARKCDVVSNQWAGSIKEIFSGIAELSTSVTPSGILQITLGRPLAHTRTLPFPPMARSAFERVVARDWTRHIIGIRATPHTVAGEPVDRGRWRAAFAPTDVLDALSQAAAEQGWSGVEIRTADDAIAGAVY